MTNFLIGNLNIDELLIAKKMLSKVNNIITVKLALAFVKFLKNKGIIQEEEYDDIRGKVLGTHPNANGFDICYPHKTKYANGIVAEVKGNIPLSKGEFGSNQKHNIYSDLDKLTGKTGKTGNLNINGFLKFMVLIECDKHVVKQIDKIIREYSNDKVVIWTDGTKPDNEHIYVVILHKEDVDEVE